LAARRGSSNGFERQFVIQTAREEQKGQMAIIKAPPKQPKTVTIQARVEESVKAQLDRYAEFIKSSTSYVITEALRLLFKRDDEFKTWLGQHTNVGNHEKPEGGVPLNKSA
jgi:predicted transcriptional regulator